MNEERPMIIEKQNQYIRTIKLDISGADNSKYPFNIESIKNVENIDLHPKVTFLVGENGSGKSTFIEALAVAYGFNPEGGGSNFNFTTHNSHSILSEHLKLIKGIKKPKDGYFLRAESFYNVASNIMELDKEGFTPPIIESYGGKSLHEQSHGESFLSLINYRFGGNGLYILDEPEAALSPARQLAVLRRIHELVGLNSQFVIATHSPILMSYPNAVIYDVDQGFEKTPYDETEQYMLYKEFINNHKRMLYYLME